MRFTYPRVAREAEFFARLEGDHGLANDLLPERLLARFGHVDLFLDRSHEPLVRRPILAGDRIGDLALIERGLDFVQVLLEELLRLVLKGGEQRLCTSSLTQRL